MGENSHVDRFGTTGNRELNEWSSSGEQSLSHWGTSLLHHTEYFSIKHQFVSHTYLHSYGRNLYPRMSMTIFLQGTLLASVYHIENYIEIAVVLGVFC
jgi:hypothetical protein